VVKGGRWDGEGGEDGEVDGGGVIVIFLRRGPFREFQMTNIATILGIYNLDAGTFEMSSLCSK
jgi:hypothetical protein